MFFGKKTPNKITCSHFAALIDFKLGSSYKNGGYMRQTIFWSTYGAEVYQICFYTVFIDYSDWTVWLPYVQMNTGLNILLESKFIRRFKYD